MGLAKGVAAGDQRHGLVVVHGHAGEGFADVDGRGLRVRVAVGTFRVHVDQAHLHRTQARVQLAFAAVALIAQPGALRPPEEFFRLPGVGTAATEAEGLETHGFERDVAGEHEQVCPGQLASVFLLDRPEQASRLVQRGVVRPAVERSEALLPAARAAAAVGDAVGPGAVPGHADKEAAVMAEIGRPPVLRIGHHLVQVGDHRIEIEGVEFGGVVEIAPVGIGAWRVLVERCQAQCFRPPIAIARAFARCAGAMTEWAAAPGIFSRFGVHVAFLTWLSLAARHRSGNPSTRSARRRAPHAASGADLPCRQSPKRLKDPG